MLKTFTQTVRKLFGRILFWGWYVSRLFQRKLLRSRQSDPTLPSRFWFKITRSNAILTALIIIMVVSGIVWLTNRARGDIQIANSPLTKRSLDAQFTCDGENLSPGLELESVPEGTKSLAIIMEDLDLDKKVRDETPFYAHWMVWNIPRDTTRILPGIRPAGTVGRNLFGNFAYGGPCPPEGKTHDYSFRFIALNKETLSVTSDATFEEAKKQIESSKIGETSFKISYKRAKK